MVELTKQLTPVAIAGGLSIGQMTTGSWHTCAKTTAAVGYCWGDGFFAQLGDGSSSFGAVSLTPVTVFGPM